MTKRTLNGKIQSWEQMLESRSGVHPNPATHWLFYRDSSREGISVLTTFISTVPMSWMIFVYTMSCFFSMLKSVCVFPDSLKSSFSSESPWNIQEGIFQQVCVWELPSLQLRRHALCFSSLQLLKCLSNAPLSQTQWVQNSAMGTQCRKTRPHRKRPHTESRQSRKLRPDFLLMTELLHVLDCLILPAKPWPRAQRKHPRALAPLWYSTGCSRHGLWKLPFYDWSWHPGESQVCW